jgi:hypothetical protein
MIISFQIFQIHHSHNHFTIQGPIIHVIYESG